MAVTLRDVARRAGVSAMTVSRVVNGGGGVDPETQRKVEDAILALDYVPNRLARGLISHKSKTIGLIVPDVVNPFFAPVVRGAETTARKAGYRVLLCNSEADLRLEREYIEDLIAHRIEGLLIAPATDRSRVSLLALQKSGFPIVLLDRSLPDFDCDSVVSDSVAGARRLVEHLIKVGHRRIAHFTESDDVSTGRDRLEGYRQALGSGAHPLFRGAGVPHHGRPHRRLPRGAASAGPRSAADRDLHRQQHDGGRRHAGFARARARRAEGHRPGLL